MRKRRFTEEQIVPLEPPTAPPFPTELLPNWQRALVEGAAAQVPGTVLNADNGLQPGSAPSLDLRRDLSMNLADTCYRRPRLVRAGATPS